ncbi:MAG: glycosyltransferase [Candidatus Aminicenantales bacterium]
MDISIVIPVLNEADKIARDIQAASAFIQAEGLRGEVIIVDDGSTDGTAERARATAVPSSVRLRVLPLASHQGKGAAVKKGVLASEGRVVIVADSGTCVPYRCAAGPMARIVSGTLDIAMASRRHRDTVIHRDRSVKRKIFSWLFRQASVVLAGIPRRFTDTQCGFKLYRGDAARDLFARCALRGFLFELEVLRRALMEGYRVEEFGVEWTCDLDSRLRPSRTALEAARDLIRVRMATKK